MPVISMFYGIIISHFNYDNKKHHQPHIHAEYQGAMAAFNIETGDILSGSIPANKSRLVQAWIEIHRDELMADWQLAITGERIFKIKPLDSEASMLRIEKVEIVKPKKLRVEFEDHTVKTCDISQFMNQGAFAELNDESLFAQLKNTGWSIEWANEVDLSADTLYEIGV